MTDMHAKQVSSAVTHTIDNYQLTSKSKLLRRLTAKNVDKITRSLIEKKQDRNLLELIKKRDHYTRKIHELLNESGEVSDPCLINDEDEAEHYIRKRLLKDHGKVRQIRDLIQKHTNFQEASAKEQELLMKKYETKRPSYGGLKKFDSMNEASQAKLESDKESELLEFYTNLHKTQSDYSAECEQVLGQLGVPFFCLPEGSSDSSHQKAFVLNLLKDTLGAER